MHLGAYVLLGFAQTLLATNVQDCSCGFTDKSKNQIYTDAIIVYFNETSTIPTQDFFRQDFVHKKEYGWTTVYRQGAVLDNAFLTNFSDVSNNSLALVVDPATSNRLVKGGAIESKRQDILYGSFRASMKGAGPQAG